MRRNGYCKREIIDKVASRKLAVTAAAGAAAAMGVVDITLPVAISSRGVYHWPEQSSTGGRFDPDPDSWSVCFHLAAASASALPVLPASSNASIAPP
jgi:hypothetical protein